MFVIMDLEWELRNKVMPTQLAAIRVNASWEVVDKFDMLIRPPFHKTNWKHVAYSGHDRDAFRSAFGADAVFRKFSQWLQSDDTMIWWVQGPSEAFFQLCKVLLQSTPVHTMRMIRPAVQTVLSDHERIGSAYELAESLGITVPHPEHCSINDTEAIRRVCAEIGLDQASITATTTTREAGLPLHVPNRVDKPDQPYYYDHKAQLLHRSDCPMLQHSENGHVLRSPLLSGHDSLKRCIRERFVPCKCCSEEYLALDEHLRQSIIASTNFSFVFRTKSSVFHKASCYQVKRIPFMDVRGATYYDTCLEHGKRPCGWCKPKRSDEIEPPHIYPADLIMEDDFISKDDLKGIWVNKSQQQWGATRRLTEQEKVALKRHKSAAKERANMPENLSGQQAHDFLTLTQPGYAFWAQAGYSNSHLRNCKRLGSLNNLRGFARYSDAVKAGLKPCRICKPTKKNDIVKSVPIYQKVREAETIEDIERSCDRHGWQHTYEGCDLYIETPAGKWKIITGTMPVDVYHINKVTQPGETIYHKQHRLFISMTDTIKYIQQHDKCLTPV